HSCEQGEQFLLPTFLLKKKLRLLLETRQRNINTRNRFSRKNINSKKASPHPSNSIPKQSLTSQ
ncbi:MAG: hypothetical protein ACI9P9_000488, partial [Patescibacteria group bacterium]